MTVNILLTTTGQHGDFIFKVQLVFNTVTKEYEVTAPNGEVRTFELLHLAYAHYEKKLDGPILELITREYKLTKEG